MDTVTLLTDPKIPNKVAVLERTYDALRFQPVAELSLEAARADRHLRSPPADAELAWHAAPPGHRWGGDWDTVWFRARVSVPDGADRLPAFVRVDTGAPESLLYVDGRAQGTIDVNHPVRLLTLRAAAGAAYEVYVEAYAGHTHPGTQPFAEAGLQNDGAVGVTPDCRVVGPSHLLVERPDVSAFVFELRVLHQLASALGDHDLRRGQILSALQRVFVVVPAKPAEVDESAWRPALAEARRAIAPLLASPAAATSPRMGIIGHSHIDTAWLWPVAETHRKLARTFSSVLSLMDQYPDFRFTASAAYHADAVRRLYPDIFDRIKRRVAEGRWEVNGAMWIEPDCNIPSGESLARQCLFGQRATREMFGVTSDTLWQPDVFGYSAALPQILRSAGVEFFCTTKLSWNDTNRFPFDTFHWEGLDGTRVLAHFNVIHCWPDPKALTEAWRAVQHPDVQDRRLVAFGYGDGGGGPMAEMIETARLCRDLEGCPRAEYADISQFMRGCRDELPDLPTHVGELYLELHRGTLTSVAAIKRGNRQCEVALHDAEFMAVVATRVAAGPYPHEPLRAAWRTLLLNQFHDILPGTSIAEVNDQAVGELRECRAAADLVFEQAARRVAGPAAHDDGPPPSVMAVNTLSWPRGGTTEVELTGLPDGTRPAGDGIVAQRFEDVQGVTRTAVVGLTIGPLGYSVVPLVAAGDGAAGDGAAGPFEVDGDDVLTPFARVRFDGRTGAIASFVDRTADRELVRNGRSFNALLLGEDVPAAWDNWDVDRDQRLKLRPSATMLGRTVVARGPLQLRVRFEYRLGRRSTLVQDVVFHSTTPRVDFDTRVDWRETHQLLKVGFDLDVLAWSARHEVQFGHVTRSAHDNTKLDQAQFDVCAHQWTDVAEEGYGVAFLNDCKYGCTVKGGEYRLTLIKSGTHPDGRGDAGEHRFTYALLPHNGGFGVQSVVRPAHELNVPLRLVPCSRRTTAAPGFTLATVDVPNVILQTVKGAEEGGGTVLRLYEAGRTRARATIRFGSRPRRVAVVNLLEESATELPVAADGSVTTVLNPFQILTLLCEWEA